MVILAKADIKKQYVLLTERELEILEDVVAGLTSKEIAAKKYVSLKTVETHRYNILKKTGAKKMIQLCSTLTKQGLLK